MNRRRLEYSFTAPGGNLSSREPLLNGAQLRIEESGALPREFAPAFAQSASSEGFLLQPRSVGFYVLLDVAVPACILSN
jgi:hypothetical protein